LWAGYPIAPCNWVFAAAIASSSLLASRPPAWARLGLPPPPPPQSLAITPMNLPGYRSLPDKRYKISSCLHCLFDELFNTGSSLVKEFSGLPCAFTGLVIQPPNFLLDVLRGFPNLKLPDIKWVKLQLSR